MFRSVAVLCFFAQVGCVRDDGNLVVEAAKSVDCPPSEMSQAEHDDASRVFTGCGKTVHFYRRCGEGNCKWIGDFIAIERYVDQAAGCYALAPLVRNVNGSEFQVAACGELLVFEKVVKDDGEMSFRLASRRPLSSQGAPEPSRGERTSYQRAERPLEPKAIFARAFRLGFRPSGGPFFVRFLGGSWVTAQLM